MFNKKSAFQKCQYTQENKTVLQYFLMTFEVNQNKILK